MERITAKFRLGFLMVLMAMVIPLSMGCLESPTQSAPINETYLPEDTVSQTDTGSVNDTTVDTVAVDTTNPPEPEPARVLARNSDQIVTNPLLNLLTSTVRLITKLLGGIVSLLDMTLQIPANALDRNTSITADIPDPDLYIYEFGPEGLQFNKPATITIKYNYADLSGVDESKIRLAWWDEANSRWVDMPCTVNTGTNTVTGQIYHFSSYGLISD